MDFEAQTEAIKLTAEEEARILGLALDRAPKELSAVDAADGDEELFYALPQGAIAAFRLEDFTRAKELAEKALALAPLFEDNWNYGNAHHFAHTVLGLLALRVDDLHTAKVELLAAGETRGSPQLDTFGPTMQLARELLKKGEFEVVLDYLQQCRSFWKMGTVWLDLWEQKMRAGGVPNFLMHCYR